MNEDCLEMVNIAHWDGELRLHDGEWNDWGCDEVQEIFVCERPFVITPPPRPTRPTTPEFTTSQGSATTTADYTTSEGIKTTHGYTTTMRPRPIVTDQPPVDQYDEFQRMLRMLSKE